MRLPPLTAEASIGPALQTYVAGAGTAPAGHLAPMGILDTLGSVLGGALDKVPCLLGCGIPNALSIAPRCGFDPACWLAEGGPAALNCIQRCL